LALYEPIALSIVSSGAAGRESDVGRVFNHSQRLAFVRGSVDTPDYFRIVLRMNSRPWLLGQAVLLFSIHHDLI
jgi:hypothetical protein